MDDVSAVANGFHGGRALLDHVERVLYRDGLSLAGSKIKVIRATSAADEFKTMRDRFNENFREWLAELGNYAPDEREERELRLEQVKALFDDAVEALRRDEYRRRSLWLHSRISDGRRTATL